MSTIEVTDSAIVSPATDSPGPDEAPFTARDFLLYAITVFSWSASWYALKVNSTYAVAPPVSTCWRFLLASTLMFVIVVLSRGRLRFNWRAHVAFALMGIFLFSTNFIFFYYASTLLVSGLLAVVFSLASVVNLAIGAVRGDVAGPRRWFGASLGVVGILLLYWPEIGGEGAGALGLALCLGGTLSFCIGNQISQSMKAYAVPVMSASAWGMAYGALWSAVLSAAAGFPFAYDTAPVYTVSLLYLTLVSTVLAFWAYLNLIARIGAGRAAYATVMFPVFALLLSTFVEGYTWTPLAVFGVVLALSGNLFVLRSARRRKAKMPTPIV
ncbi:MAG: DMT family transporter [Granulosicoccus sp.]|nr:DMT family transporter [Granulosicoccus sp.]